ncbi:oxygenase MpaB family protein [Natronohydrobacter thiooxidans]|jgi:hypothetical protein|uniref:oxygenase MpaB family protein n=1 Tax=Natronohydrobacter thiooxidans TaxID=87172 RepID=UPI0008FF1A8D|nr:oxygenase MpaB family protein [Natronohydrobacter thiooxidans]
MVDMSGRKWIAREIEKLDPYTDYAEIIRLAATYRSNDAFMDLIYSVTFPNFITGNHGSRSIVRNGKGKVVRHMERRMDDTSRHILIWTEYGPDHEYTKRSIDSLNQLHKFWSKHYPEGFEPVEDWQYVIAYEVTLFHRLLRRVGAKGFSEKEKIASYEFYKRIAPQFRRVLTDEPIPITFQNFDDCMEFVERYENTRRAENPDKHLVQKYVIDAFATRNFPRFLQPAMRQLIYALMPEGTMKNWRIRQNPIARFLARRAFRAFLWIGENIAPDPKISHPERIRQRDGLTEEEYVAQVARGMKSQPTPESDRIDDTAAIPAA